MIAAAVAEGDGADRAGGAACSLYSVYSTAQTCGTDLARAGAFMAVGVGERHERGVE